MVLIESDDQTLDSMRFMPRTEQLIGEKGATFPVSIASWPLCCPSRATLLTGQYAHNHGVLGNKDAPLGGFDRLDSETALPVWMENAGYYTAHIGKYLNGYEESPVGVPPGWTEWHGSKDTYKYYGYTLLEDGENVQYGNPLEDPDNPADPASYSTDVYTDKAVEIIDRRAPDPEPFFLSLAYLAPHSGAPAAEPGQRPERLRRLRQARQAPHRRPRRRADADAAQLQRGRHERQTASRSAGATRSPRSSCCGSTAPSTAARNRCSRSTRACSGSSARSARAASSRTR